MKDDGIWYDSEVGLGSAQFRIADSSRLIYYFRGDGVSVSTVSSISFWCRKLKRQIAHVELVRW